MHLDLETFRVLDCVVTEGSFSRAAQKLNRAQSAISYQIKKLEDGIGVSVFDRTGYRAVLTPAGETLWRESKHLLAAMSRVESVADQFSTGWEPRLKLIVDGAMPISPVMAALKQLVDDKIPTRIRLRTEFLDGVVQAFEAKDADMMLVLGATSHTNFVLLPRLRMRLVVGRDHMLCQRSDVSQAILRDHVELTIQKGQQIESQSHLQFDSDRAFYLSDFSSKKEALLMGMGFGWMPEYMIRTELARGDLSLLDYENGNLHDFIPRLVNLDNPQGRASNLLSSALIAEFEGFSW